MYSQSGSEINQSSIRPSDRALHHPFWLQREGSRMKVLLKKKGTRQSIKCRSSFISEPFLAAAQGGRRIVRRKPAPRGELQCSLVRLTTVRGALRSSAIGLLWAPLPPGVALRAALAATCQILVKFWPARSACALFRKNVKLTRSASKASLWKSTILARVVLWRSFFRGFQTGFQSCKQKLKHSVKQIFVCTNRLRYSRERAL